MADPLRLKENYALSRCCDPSGNDTIVGYFSHNNVLKVHRVDCPNLHKADQSRLVPLEWSNILAEESFAPDADYDELDGVDFAILRHHRDYGVDYSLVVARAVQIEKEIAFNRHRKLRDMGLLCRVEPTMIQYRRGIVDNKWIKHRNHTYYGLTDKGEQYLEYYLKENRG